MIRLGYALSSEEHTPLELVRLARRAEEVGFEYALISDHFHPWIDRQGESAFVWGVIGGIAQATERLRLGTGVTAPTIRTHPAIVAHAAATSACLMPGRFFLGVGTGEALNEHILGDPWPPASVRRDMLEEAIEVMRLLWTGDTVEHRGTHYTVENARIYSLPDTPPEIYVAASGPKAAELAGRTGDGFVGVAPQAELVDGFEQAGGRGKPKVGQVTVCWAESEDEGVRTAHEWWPNAGLGGELTQVLSLPAHFEAACETVRPEDVAESVVCGPDVGRHLARIREYADAGYDHVYVHQVGPNQEGFFSFYERELHPAAVADGLAAA
jgi:coenzyme F420-dependent glucose-6-phosphate dehydrogenase